MSQSSRLQNRLPWYARGLLLLAAGVCLLLGVVGLVLPILPGLLFLGLAVWLLSKVSNRAARYLNTHGTWRRQQRLWSSAGHLNPGQRLQLGFWLAVRSLLTSLQSLTQRLPGKR